MLEARKVPKSLSSRVDTFTRTSDLQYRYLGEPYAQRPFGSFAACPLLAVRPPHCNV